MEKLTEIFDGIGIIKILILLIQLIHLVALKNPIWIING
ncbi:MAG: hypothetical protein RLZZ490_2424 [Cyanobacteriota bacterium]|jgi:hypothetical protein